MTNSAYFDFLSQEYFGAFNPLWPSLSVLERIVEATVPRLYDDVIVGGARGVRIDQGALGIKIRIPLMSLDTACILQLEDPQLVNADVRIREASGVLSAVYAPDDPPQISSDGRNVIFTVPKEIVDYAGVYFGQVRILNNQTPPIELLRDSFYIYNDRGLWLSQHDAAANDFGPPSFQEIRTLLRDHPVTNRLLENFEFHPAEIAIAVVRTVQHFNSEFPHVGVAMTTQNISNIGRFPVTNGVIANLLEIALNFFRRNKLMYKSGETVVNDLERDREYLQALMYFRQNYEKWIAMTKQTVNFFGMFGGIGSGYPGRAVRAIF